MKTAEKKVLENLDLLTEIILFLPYTQLTEIAQINITFKKIASNQTILKHHLSFLAPWFNKDEKIKTKTLDDMLKIRLKHYRNAEKTQLCLADPKKYNQDYPETKTQKIIPEFYQNIHNKHQDQDTDIKFKQHTQDLLGCYHSFVSMKHQQAHKIFTKLEKKNKSCLAQSGIARTALLLIQHQPNMNLIDKLTLFNTAVEYLNKSLEQAFMYNNIFSIYSMLSQLACKLYVEINNSNDMHQDMIEYLLDRPAEKKLRNQIRESDRLGAFLDERHHENLTRTIQESYEDIHKYKITQARARITLNFGTHITTNNSTDNKAQYQKK